MAGSIASSWPELSGKNDWDKLLHPLDLDLRRYIIHYLQRAGAAGDIFNGNKESKGYKFSLYPPEGLFATSGLEVGNPYKYRVTNFIYAVVENEPEWIGYVAVATDEGKAILGRRDILVSWRGSVTQADLHDDLRFLLVPASELFPREILKPLVHAGFHSIYTGTIPDSPYCKTSARDQALKAVQEQVDKYQNEEAVSITITGHSLGSALATLNAMDIVYNGCNKPTGNSDKSFMVTAFVAACPHVGEEALFGPLFNRLNKDHDLHLLRIVNAHDPVPTLPPLIGYTDVGEHLDIDTSKSSYLKPIDIPHNLDVYTHGVAGVQENGEFKLEEELHFDNAIVNKHGGDLVDNLIPEAWWNNTDFKGMVQMDDGHWKLVDSDYVPDPPTA
ncbi:Lipase, class 3 [Corchorus capsularis]|uniref:Phospholipase A1 n=1 Tax=Corchorus capsularis TaxID=210143 RepID=A0A1R3I114_COCAP|nr:Lipase, class 3 [Corchorus capsularis]